MKILRLPIIKYILIPLFLLFLWVALSFVANPYENFTSFTVSNHLLKNNTPSVLYKGNKIEGQFVANENYLGTVLLTFSSVPHVVYESQDKLLFRIKEEGSSKWYYESIYHSGGFRRDIPYTFGFPKISDSSGKTYIFQLISLDGNKLNAVKVRNTFGTRFISNKEYLFHDKHLLLNFIYKKIIYSLMDRYFFLDSFVYLTPLLFYIILLLASSRYSNNIFFSNGKAIFASTFLLVLLYSIFTIRPIIGISIFIIGWWLILILLKKVSSRTSFIFFAVLLAFGYIGIMLSQVNFSDRISSWAYIFLAFGAFQALFEAKVEK